MDDRPVMRAVYQSCRSVGGADEVRASLDGFLSAHEVEDPDRSAMVNAGAKRLLTYRRMVRHRLHRCIEWRLPRVSARLGSRLGSQLSQFLHESSVQAAYLREVPRAFAEWAIPVWQADPEIPEFLPDLARHELLHLEVTDAVAGGEPPTGVPVEPGRGVVFDGAVLVRRYGHAVHALPKSRDDRSVPEAKTTCILAYRDAAFEARYLELSTLSEALVASLFEDGEPLGQAVERVATALGGLDDTVLQRIGVFMADLRERGVLLGGRP